MATEYFEHVTKVGDRWDLIAYSYYGDATLIKKLLLANPAIVGDPTTPTPLVFGAGINIRVPILAQDEISVSQLPAWKR
jgi:phage tail protein X